MRPNPTAQGEVCGAPVGPALFQCNCAAGFANGICDMRKDRWHSGRTYTHDAVQNTVDPHAIKNTVDLKVVKNEADPKADGALFGAEVPRRPL
jgi:hypothetical protein